MKKNMSCKKKKYDMKKTPKMSLSLFICSNFDCYTLASFQLKNVKVNRSSIQLLHEKLQYLIVIYLLQCPTVDLALFTLQGPKTSAARPGARVPSPPSKYTHSTSEPGSRLGHYMKMSSILNSVSLCHRTYSLDNVRLRSKASLSKFYGLEV